MSATTYVLAVSSQKGGTGRTTTAMALAWSLARAGLSVTLVDADRAGALSTVLGIPTDQLWQDVALLRQIDWSIPLLVDADIAVIDAPALTSPEAPAVLRKADGVLLTALADPLSTRTLPSAIRSLERVRNENPGLNLLGVLLTSYLEKDPIQSQIREILNEAHPELILPSPIPREPSLRDWSESPAALPDGIGRASYLAGAQYLLGKVLPAIAAKSAQGQSPLLPPPVNPDAQIPRPAPRAPSRFVDRILLSEPRIPLRRRPMPDNLLGD